MLPPSQATQMLGPTGLPTWDTLGAAVRLPVAGAQQQQLLASDTMTRQLSGSKRSQPDPAAATRLLDRETKRSATPEKKHGGPGAPDAALEPVSPGTTPPAKSRVCVTGTTASPIHRAPATGSRVSGGAAEAVLPARPYAGPFGNTPFAVPVSAPSAQGQLQAHAQQQQQQQQQPAMQSWQGQRPLMGGSRVSHAPPQWGAASNGQPAQQVLPNVQPSYSQAPGMLAPAPGGGRIAMGPPHQQHGMGQAGSHYHRPGMPHAQPHHSHSHNGHHHPQHHHYSQPMAPMPLPGMLPPPDLLYGPLDWATQQPSQYGPMYTALARDMVVAVEDLTPDEGDVRVRMALLRELEAGVRAALPEYPHLQVLPFGSFVNGLGTRGSDIDVVVVGVRSPRLAARGWYEKDERVGVARLLDRVCASLRRRPSLEIRSQLTIRHARIPLLKLRAAIRPPPGGPDSHKHAQQGQGVEVQVDVSIATAAGPEAARFVASQAMERPALRPLVLVVKKYLKGCELNDVATGGLSSYGLTYMILAHLMEEEKAGKDTHDIGYMLHRFFRRFGTVFDVQRSAVSIAAGGIVPRARVPEVGFAHFDRVVCVDPLTGRDVTEGTYRADEVLAAFQRADSYLSTVAARYPNPKEEVPSGVDILEGLLQDMPYEAGSGGQGGSEGEGQGNDDYDDDLDKFFSLQEAKQRLREQQQQKGGAGAGEDLSRVGYVYREEDNDPEKEPDAQERFAAAAAAAAAMLQQLPAASAPIAAAAGAPGKVKEVAASAADAEAAGTSTSSLSSEGEDGESSSTDSEGSGDAEQGSGEDTGPSATESEEAAAGGQAAQQQQQAAAGQGLWVSKVKGSGAGKGSLGRSPPAATASAPNLLDIPGTADARAGSAQASLRKVQGPQQQAPAKAAGVQRSASFSKQGGAGKAAPVIVLPPPDLADIVPTDQRQRLSSMQGNGDGNISKGKGPQPQQRKQK